jgi:hypothetical protein
VRRYFAVSKSVIVSMAFLVVACSSPVRDVELPAWVTTGDVSETTMPVSLNGEWILNETLSDNPKPLIRRAVETLKKDRRNRVGPPRGTAGRSMARAGNVLESQEEPDPNGEAALTDPRLAALWAKSLHIKQSESAISFTFNDETAVSHLINEATSSDQNINLSFAGWEGSQFVVEKNGPNGLMLERWTLSPDRSQLYLLVSLEIKMPDFPISSEPVFIRRMFDRDLR